MSFRRLSAIARKETIHIMRDPRSLGMGIAIPLLLLLLFGYALTLDVDDVPLVVWDQSETPLSRELIRQFAASPYFSLKRNLGSYGEIEQSIDRRIALMALVIPVDFAGRIEAGRPATVQAIVDGSDANTAQIAIGYAEAITRTYSLQVALRTSSRAAGTTQQLPIDLRPRVWFNADMESRNYIVPGLIAVIMMVIAALMTSLTVAREWESGTMEQLISTPVRGPELIAGKLLPYFAIGMLDVLLSVLLGQFLFKVPLRGNVAILFVTAAVFLTGALSLGMLISIVTKSQLVATQLAMVLTFLPSFLLSGFMYDIGNMPRAVQVITYVVPARYFVGILKGIYLKGVGPGVLGMEVLLLLVFGTVVVLVANLKFKKKLEA